MKWLLLLVFVGLLNQEVQAQIFFDELVNSSNSRVRDRSTNREISGFPIRICYQPHFCEIVGTGSNANLSFVKSTSSRYQLKQGCEFRLVLGYSNVTSNYGLTMRSFPKGTTVEMSYHISGKVKTLSNSRVFQGITRANPYQTVANYVINYAGSDIQSDVIVARTTVTISSPSVNGPQEVRTLNFERSFEIDIEVIEEPEPVQAVVTQPRLRVSEERVVEDRDESFLQNNLLETELEVIEEEITEEAFTDDEFFDLSVTETWEARFNELEFYVSVISDFVDTGDMQRVSPELLQEAVANLDMYESRLVEVSPEYLQELSGQDFAKERERMTRLIEKSQSAKTELRKGLNRSKDLETEKVEARSVSNNKGESKGVPGWIWILVSGLFIGLIALFAFLNARRKETYEPEDIGSQVLDTEPEFVQTSINVPPVLDEEKSIEWPSDNDINSQALDDTDEELETDVTDKPEKDEADIFPKQKLENQDDDDVFEIS